MLQELLESKALFYVMAALCAIGILSKLAVWVSHRRLMKATEDMAASKNTLTRQLKLKFENCYRLHLQVQNVPAFVDKYLQKHKVFGIRVHTLGRFLQITLLANGMLGVAGCAGVVWLELPLRYLVRYAAAAVLTVMLLYLVDYVLDVEDKCATAVTNLQDYLDNVLTNRLQHESEIAGQQGAADASMPAQLHRLFGEKDVGACGAAKESAAPEAEGAAVQSMAASTQSAARKPAARKSAVKKEEAKTAPVKPAAQGIQEAQSAVVQNPAVQQSAAVQSGAAQSAASSLKKKTSKAKKAKERRKESIEEEEVIREILREFLT